MWSTNQISAHTTNCCYWWLYPCRVSYRLHHGLGNSWTGELFQTNSQCYGRGSAVASSDLATVSEEREFYYLNSRTECGSFVQHIRKSFALWIDWPLSSCIPTNSEKFSSTRCELFIEELTSYAIGEINTVYQLHTQRWTTYQLLPVPFYVLYSIVKWSSHRHAFESSNTETMMNGSIVFKLMQRKK